MSRFAILTGIVGISIAFVLPASSKDAYSAGPWDRYMQLALDCVHREYPNKISHVLDSDADVASPRVLHPVFYGCYDWHSSVHGHWLLVRLLRMNPDSTLAQVAREALNQSFQEDGVAWEVSYLKGDKTFERPYGTAWLLQLTAELREWDDADAKRWLVLLEPLEEAAVQQYLSWLPNLVYPIRIGTHNQTAFAFSLVFDWAKVSGHDVLLEIIEEKTRDFYLADRHCPLNYEPSGEDFLSPCLGEADLVRRILSQEEFAVWLGGFLPEIPLDGSSDWLEPGKVLDPSDGKLVHLDGVNLSRAWNLQAIGYALPVEDSRRTALLATAQVHADSGLSSVSSEHYEGGHWLASFATYLTSNRWAAP